MKPYNKSFIGAMFPDKNAFTPDDVHACPLCGAKNYLVVGKFEINTLIDMWVAQYGFNPIDDARHGQILERRRCAHCGLFFYNIHLPDSEELYAKLDATGKYYPSFRAEYGTATEIIEKLKPNSLLEIGSGNGSFLGRVRHIIPRAVGSEYNRAAADACRTRGLDIITEDIGKICERFDVVCHFEVLEHVFDTRTLMNNAVRLLRPGGKLIIGTPDPDGILSVTGTGVLNLPPHHQFDFSKDTFDWLAREFNLRIFDYQKSELDYYQYCVWVNSMTGIWPPTPDIPGFFKCGKKRTGHSHLVVFEKKRLFSRK